MEESMERTDCLKSGFVTIIGRPNVGRTDEGKL